MTQDTEDSMPVFTAALKERFEQLGYEVFSYSGRYMYGARCIAVRLDRKKNHSEWELAQNCAKFDFYLESPKLDDLGKDKVAYWPDIEYEEESEQGEPAPS